MADFAPFDLAGTLPKPNALNPGGESLYDRALKLGQIGKLQGEAVDQANALSDRAGARGVLATLPATPGATDLRAAAMPLYRFDPKVAKDLIDAAAGMDTAERENKAKVFEQFGKASIWVGQATDPAEQTRRAAFTVDQFKGMGLPIAVDPAQLAANWQFFGALGANAKEVFDGPIDKTTIMRNVEAAGFKPGTPEYEQRVAELSKPSALVNIDQRLETAYDKERGVGQAKQIGDLEDAAKSATTIISSYRTLGGLLSNVNTGKFADWGQQGKATIKSLFGDDALTKLGIADDTAAAQAAKSIGNELALQFRSPAGGAGMPGSMSDSDRQFLVSIPPGLENVPEAIPLMVDLATRREGLKIEQAKQAIAYEKAHGRFDAGFWPEWQKYADEHPIFTQADQQRVQALAGKIPNAGRAGAPAAPGPLQTTTTLPAGAEPMPDLRGPNGAKVYRVPDETRPGQFKLITEGAP